MHVLPILVAAALGAWLQPPVTALGVRGGSHWMLAHNEQTVVRPTIGVAAYSPVRSWLDLEFGLAYRQDARNWVCGFFCLLDGPDWDRGNTYVGYIDASALARVHLVSDDGLNLHVVLGPKQGIPVSCRRENITQGTGESCDLKWHKDTRLVAGVGVVLRPTRRLGLTASYRYGLDPWELPEELDADYSDHLAMTLTAGIVYRLDLRDRD